MKKTQNSIFLVIIMFVLAAAVVAGFFWLRNVELRNQENGKNRSEVEKLIELDLDINYPGNAREVLKVNNRFIKCYYNEDLTDQQLKKLTEQNRKLFDKELLERNPYETYLEKLKKDIETYKKSNVTIVNVGIQDLAEAETEERGGYKFCNPLVSFFLKEGNGHKTTNQKYYLREDENGRWKILFWEVTQKTF